MKRKLLLIFFTALLFLSSNLLSQPMPRESASISGFVYDKENGEGLAGANIYIAKLETGSATNVSGYYVISDLNTGMYTLVCSFIGYKADTVKVNITNENDYIQNFNLIPKSIQTEIT